MKSKWPLIACALGAAVCVAGPAFALLVQPLVIDLMTTGARSSGAITVVNDRRAPETVEVTVSKLKLAERGPPELTPDKGDDFLIFPPRATIAPGKTQVFRVRWVGEPVLPEAKAYMFSTTELPVSQAKSSGVQLLYSIQSLVTVSSPSLRPALSIGAVERGSQTVPPPPNSPAGTQSAVVPGIVITAQNKGAAHDYLSHYRMTLRSADGKWTAKIDQQELAKAVGLGLVPASSRRIFNIPVAGVPASAISATIDPVTVR